MGETVVEGWSDQEQSIARTAFERAYERAIEQLVQAIQSRSSALSSAQNIWDLHDFLSIERHTMEGRFDFRLDGILFTFASLVKDNLLQLDELTGLASDKLSKIAAMARF
jgi:hypothetical protein